MELWIRSQNKRYLQKIKSLCLDDNDNEERVIIYGNISDEDFELGSYATIERALEVLDEIEGLLVLKQGLKLTTDAIFSVENNLAIYEMPKEW